MTTYFLSSVLLLSLVACDPEGNGDTSDTGKDVVPTESAARVQGDASGSGDVVIVREDGDDFEPAGSGTADADGHYSIEVSAALGEANTFVVQFSGDDGSSGEAVVTAEVAEDDVLYAGDIDEESSAEAAVYTEIVVSGDSSGSDDAFYGKLLVDANAASSLTADGSQTAAEAEVEAKAAAQAVIAARSALAASIDAGTDGAAEATIEAMATAESSEAQDGTFDGDARASVGLSALLASAESDDEDRAELAVGLNAAVQAVMTTADDDGTMTSVEAMVAAELVAEHHSRSTAIVAEGLTTLSLDGAGDEASAELSSSFHVLVDGLLQDGSGSAATQLEGELSAAWSGYASAILAELSLGLSAGQAADTAEALSVATGLYAELEADIEANAQNGGAEAVGEATYEAYAQFYADATEEVTASLVAGGSFSAAEANAMASVIVQLAASGGGPL